MEYRSIDLRVKEICGLWKLPYSVEDTQYGPVFHYSSIPWPRPGFTDLSSIASSSLKLQRHQALLCTSCQGGPLLQKNSGMTENPHKPPLGAD